MTKNYVVVQESPIMRIVIGVLRDVEIDENEFRHSLSKRLRIPVADISLIAEAQPRTPTDDPETVKRLQMEFTAYLNAGDVDVEDEVGFLSVYYRLMRAGATIPTATSIRVSDYITQNRQTDTDDGRECPMLTGNPTVPILTRQQMTTAGRQR